MEDRVVMLQRFLEELNKYCDASKQTDMWYEDQRLQLSQEQERKRMLNEENFKKQQNSFTALQEKNASDRDALQEKIRERILQKKSVLERNIRNNENIRDQILNARDQIARPEYFQYAYRYREYGDFYPEITRLDDFKKINLEKMVEQINRGSASIWVNKLKALFKSEDMMIEYASFANLLGKARYLCEVENDALHEKAYIEICQMEKELGEAEESFLSKGADLLQQQQQIQKDNIELTQMFTATCNQETAALHDEYKERQMTDYNSLMAQLQENYTPQIMEQVYQELEEVDPKDRKVLCTDGVPVPVKLGQLWFLGADLLQNDRVRQLLESSYPFLVREGNLSIPGII